MLKKLLYSCVLGWMTTLSYAQNPIIPPCQNPDRVSENANVPCGAILVFGDAVSGQDRVRIAQGHGAKTRVNFQLSNASAVVVPSNAVLKALHRDSHIEQVIPDRIMQTQKKPDNPGNKGSGGGDAGQVTPAGVVRIGAAPGNLPVTGAAVGVGIVDTGLDLNNQDLNVSASCFTAYSSCDDDNGHGTHVGGIVAAKDNTQDVVGVAPEATLYAVKVLDNSGSGSDSSIIAGLEWVAMNAQQLTPEIKVINMSLGRAGNANDNPVLRQTVANLVNNLGISVVVAAGNDASKEIQQMVPASYPEVMAVASTAAEDGVNGGCRVASGPIVADTASYFSTDGSGVAISAPGERLEKIRKNCFVSSEGILSLQAGGGVTRKSGTSMAAPHVAGVVALMLDDDASLTPSEIRDAIKLNAQLLGSVPYDSPVSSYSFDGVREGVISACGVLGLGC